MVWDIHGGSTPETRALMHRLGGFVAIVEGDNLARVYARLSEQVAVMLARGAGHALRRRRKTGTLPTPASGVAAGLILEP
jgi:hypothetical protein